MPVLAKHSFRWLYISNPVFLTEWFGYMLRNILCRKFQKAFAMISHKFSHKFRFSHLSLVLCSVSVLALPACTAVGVATGLGAAGGIAAAQEGGLSRAAKDAQIQVQINNLWFQYDVDTFRKLDMTVNQGRVLITGVVQDPEHRVEAVRLAWQPSGVKQVIN